MSPRQPGSRKYDGEFLLPPSERAIYGITVTVRDLVGGKTRTIAHTNMTALDGLRLVVNELDLLPGDWRVLTVSTPVTIMRDCYASRVVLSGDDEGGVGQLPERILLAKIKRLDRLHPSRGTLPEYAGQTHRRNA